MFKSKLASGDIGAKWHKRFDNIAQRHSALTGYRVLERLPVSRALLLCALLVTLIACLLYTSPSPRDLSTSRMPSSA